MITRLLKLFVYAFIVFFAIAGLISMKDKFMKFDSNESFEEQEEEDDNKKDDSNDEIEEDNNNSKSEPSSPPPVVTEDSSKNNDELTGNIDEKICNPDVVRQIKRNFVTKFNNFKNNLNNDLNTFQRVLESDIHNMFIEKEENENETQREGVDPIIMYDDSNEDEDEEELKETFIQDMYDGITSPYCLNCREL
jgi:hypothetical protein